MTSTPIFSAENPQASRRFLIGLILANLVIRVAWIIYMHPQQLADFDWYFTRAVQMANGEGYIWGKHGHTAYWPIGWPFVLSLVVRIFGPHMMAGLFTNALLSIGIVVLVYVISLRVFASHRIAAAAAIGYTLLPSHIIWNAILGSEELFTFLLMLSMYFYVRLFDDRVKRWLTPTLLAGLMMGFACDVRPVGMLFPICVLLYEWFIQRRRFVHAFQRAFAYGVAMACGIAPVTIRNLVALHHFVLVSTNGGVNLWQGTKIDGGYYWSWDKSVNPLLQAGTNEVLEDKIGKHAFLSHLYHHPLSVMHHGVIKIIDLYKDDTNSVWYTFHVINPSKHLLYTMDAISSGGYYIFMIVAFIGLCVLIRTKWQWRKITFPLLFIVYNTAIFAFFPAWDRFRFPLMPLFAPLLGLGVIGAYLWIRGQRQQHLD